MTKRHFAKIGLNNKVEDITILDSSSMTDVTGVEQEQMGINFLKWISNWDLWKQFWADGSQRKNPAAKGFTYDETRDAFIPIKPFPSWTLNEATCRWVSPIGDAPDDGKIYTWNEDNKSWEELTE